LDHRLGRAPPDPHQILSIDLTRGVHQPMRQLAVRCEKQQSGGVDIQPADRDPAPTAGRRKALEDRWTPLRIVARSHFTNRLVIEQQLPGWRLYRAEIDLTSIEQHFITRFCPISELRDATTYGDASIADPLLDATS